MTEETQAITPGWSMPITATTTMLVLVCIQCSKKERTDEYE